MRFFLDAEGVRGSDPLPPTTPSGAGRVRGPGETDVHGAVEWMKQLSDEPQRNVAAGVLVPMWAREEPAAAAAFADVVSMRDRATDRAVSTSPGEIQ